jgi:NAD(P)-dependent dehydrogenase (short-subunit alcohol dehydrogenase family)
MNKLDCKRVVITGAGSGLGRSMSLVLAHKGCRIGATDIDGERATETLEMVERAGGSGEVFRLDVSRPEEVEAMAAHFFDAWGGVDLLVNNAGVAVSGFIGDVPLEDWRWIIGVNLWGVIHGCHSFVPRMKEQGGGHILNVSAGAGFIAPVEMSPYNTTKGGVISLTETMVTELTPFNIGVTLLCPMFFDTNLLDNLHSQDEFENRFAHAAFDGARMSSDGVAEAAIRAVEKGVFFCVPQFTGKFLWLNKRLSPTTYFKLMPFLNRRGWLRPLMIWMARKGLT